jgi:hypothetical protein
VALTPTPVPGNTITATWGTEIRNRTIQVFASVAEVNAWAAPNGSIAYDLGSNRLYIKLGGVWKVRSTSVAGFTTGNTNAQSDLTITHGVGIIPTAIICTPSHETNTNTAMIQVTAKTTSTFTIRVRNYNGVGQADTTVGIHWLVSI